MAPVDLSATISNVGPLQFSLVSGVLQFVAEVIGRGPCAGPSGESWTCIEDRRSRWRCVVTVLIGGPRRRTADDTSRDANP